MKKNVLVISDQPQSNYLQRILTQIRTTPLRPGTVSCVTVKHDAWCMLLKNRGACNCQPDIELTEVQE